jgi:hypothetical protein
MNFNFQYIQPVDLHKHWFHVKQGLEAILKKAFDTWIPEDVYCAVKTGAAQLFLIDGGFVVMQSCKDQWSNEPYLHIWITYHENGGIDVTDEFHSNLRKLADNAGIRKITFSSTRRWERKSGAKVKEIIYELEY